MLHASIRRAAIVLLAAASCAAFGAAPSKNKAPTVTLVSPAAGAGYTAPATVQLEASAQDSDGTIAKVEFFRGSTSIATVTAAPYRYTWSGVAAGSYSITAKATDNAGATATSAAIAVTVASASSATTITSPTPATQFDWPITDVSGTFSGAGDTTILVTNGGSSMVSGSVTGANTFVARNLLLDPGLNTITATAVRRDGTSSSGSVTVDVQQRLVVLTSPKKGASYEMPPSLTFSASTLLSSGTVQRVEYWRTFVGPIGTSTTPPFDFTLNNPAKGNYTVYALLVDDKGRTRQSDEVTFSVVGPNVAPAVSLTAPANGASFIAPATFNLQATASDSDGAVSSVEFLRNGQVIGTTNVAPYTFAVSALAAGNYSFNARATDDKGAVTTSAPVNVSVALPAPTVALTAPLAGASYFAPATVTLAANATPPAGGSIAAVRFYANGNLLGSATSAPYTFTWSGAQAGAYAVTAVAVDALGVPGTSAALNVVVASPAITITGPDAAVPIPPEGLFVTGRISAPRHSGVSVNGTVAIVDASGNFYANGVRPVDGALVATLTTSDEARVQANLTLTGYAATGTTVRPETTEDIASIDSRITIANTQGIGRVDIDFGYGSIGYSSASDPDFVPGTEESVVHLTYAAPGTYLPVIHVTDMAGQTTRHPLAISVVDPVQLDQKVQELWSRIVAKVKAGDLAGAMKGFIGSKREKFVSIFGSLQPDASTALGQLGSPIAVSASPEDAEYEFRRDVGDAMEAYPVHWVREADGVWRISEM